MNKLKCQFKDHQERKITSVCMDKDCNNMRLCCYLCKSESHKGHFDKIIEVEQISDFIQQQNTKQVQFSQKYCQSQNYIVKGLENLSNLVNELQKIIKDKLGLITQQNLSEYLNQSINKQQGIEYWNQYIQGMLKYVVTENGLLLPKQQNEGQLSEQELKYIQIIKKSEQDIQEIIQSITSLGLKHLQFSNKPLELGHKSQVYSVAISQDGSLIASGSGDKTIKLWDGKTKTLLQTIENDSGVYNITISSKNEYIAFSNGQNFYIELFDLKSNKVQSPLKQHTKAIQCIIFSQDTQYLLSGGFDNKLIIWSLINKTKIHYFETESGQCIQSIVMSRDNKLVSCICSEQGNIYIWDFQTKTQLFQEKYAHSKGYGFCTSTDSSIFISSGGDGLIKIWKLNQSLISKKSLTLTRSIQAATNQIEKVLLTSDNLYIISFCMHDLQIMIHEMNTGKLIQVLKVKTEDYKFKMPMPQFKAFISISNDMNTLVSNNDERESFKIWTKE